LFADDVVTGLHDIDEYIQAQLLLAVSSARCVVLLLGPVQAQQALELIDFVYLMAT